MSKRAQAPATVDPLGQADAIVRHVVNEEGDMLHMNATAKLHRDVFLTAMISQAVNRLTEAVQDQTQAINRANAARTREHAASMEKLSRIANAIALAPE